MNQKNIRTHNGTAFSVPEAAEWLKELDDRTKSSVADFNSIDEIAKSSTKLYKKDITINGDHDKYYQVVIKKGNQNKVRNIRVYRGYSEQAPDNWNTASHKGGLILDIRANFGAWGGASYAWKILDNRSVYTTLFADAGNTNHQQAFYMMLRGGGAIYHIESDEHLNDVQVAYSSSEITFDHSNPAYKVYALDPLTSPNTANIDAHTYKVGI